MARYPTANLEHPGRSIDLVVHMWMAEMPVVGVGWGRIPEPTQGEIAIYKRSGRAKRGLKITGPGTRISVHGEGSHRGRLDSSQAARAVARKGEQSLLLDLKRPH